MSLFEFVRGQVVERGTETAVIAVGGIGLRLLIPSGTAAALPDPGAETMLYAHLLVREDALTLYGFASREERTLFEHLLAVNGVGPKAALSLLSLSPPERLAASIAGEDAAALAKAPGIGQKTASRIVLELKGKLKSALPAAVPVGAATASAPVSGSLEVAAKALQEWGGYSAAEALTAVAALPQDRELSEEEAVELAFRFMGSKK